VYETKVGFKEFKPVIGKALVCFEESDGISIIGHTPEKDAYIGLLLALDMVVHTGMNLGALQRRDRATFRCLLSRPRWGGGEQTGGGTA
jgi:phosphomannomutase